MTGETSLSSVDTGALFSEFLKLFTHELRSPLSILATDLQYLTTPGADQTISSWKGALTRITEQLNALGKLSEFGATTSYFSATLLRNQMERCTDMRIDAPIDRSSIPGDGPTIIGALTEMLSLHQVDHPPILILNSRQVVLNLITPQQISNRHPSAFFSTAFELNPRIMPLKLWMAELVLRLTGAVFDLNNRQLTITLPLHEYTRDLAC